MDSNFYAEHFVTGHKLLEQNHLQRALGHPAAQVRTGGLPSILQQMALLIPAQAANQGR